MFCTLSFQHAVSRNQSLMSCAGFFNTKFPRSGRALYLQHVSARIGRSSSARWPLTVAGGSCSGQCSCPRSHGIRWLSGQPWELMAQAGGGL